MNPIITIFRKEMTDMLRDRRTIMAMIILPLLLLPTIFTLAGKFIFPNRSTTTTLANTRVAVYSNDNGTELLKRFDRRRDITLYEGVSPYTFEQLLQEDSIDYGLIIKEDFDEQIANGQTGVVELFHLSEGRDSLGHSRVTKTIRDFHEDIIGERLQNLGTSRAILKPTRIKKTNVHKQTGSIGAFAGSVLPIFFVVFCYMGAMYPGIDLFTGEKERGTIETLLVLPVNRIQLLTGKLLVVVTAGVISGLLTFVGLYTFLQFTPKLSFIAVSLNLKAAFWIILMMVPLTTFFAGLIIPIAIYAKSFKEAQSLIQPLLIIIVIPIILAMIPTFQLNAMTAVIPIMNVALACKAIVADTLNVGHLMLVYSSLFLLAILGILLAKRGFGAERNIFRT